MTSQTEQIVMSNCCSHCGGTCMLKVHVKDGVITRIETDDGPEPQYRACLRGRAYRQRVYAPDRLKFPMKRVGARGDGKFQRISWDEALDTVARELKRVRDSYGQGAIMYLSSAGDIASIHGSRPVSRLLTMFGGYSTHWGVGSNEAAVFAELATYGSLYTRNSRDDLFNSRLIILWGWDPANSVSDSNTTWYLAQARERGSRIISIDPRYTDTTTLAHQWIPIRPGTDAALLLAMAYVIIKENLQDQKFIDTYTTGFRPFRSYLLGEEDEVSKTPSWAEEVTGVPATTIQALAREYATLKPAALIAGIGPGRTAYGEQYHRAAIVLAALTGNIGVHGGDAAGMSWTGSNGYPFLRLRRSMGAEPNQVDAKIPARKTFITGRQGYLRGIGVANVCKVSEAILQGRAGGYLDDYKLLFLVNIAYPIQHLNVNKAIRALKTLEFIVVLEHFMTPGAKFADILLPTTTLLERNDITIGEATPFYGCMNKAIDPLYETKSHLEICNLLAPRLGISNFNDKTDEEWLRQIIKESGIPDYQDFRSQGVFRVPLSQPHVAFEQQLKDPQNNPFPTPSRKIEIYSQQLADMGVPLLPAIPKYIPTWEGRDDPLAKKYPLQLITTHFKRRAHTQFDNLPWLRELLPQAVTINTADAQARGIRDGDMVRVFNDRGEMLIPSWVTERIMPGVVDIPQGAWYDPDERGVDRGGCANVLTRDESSPCGAFPSNTSLVEVRRA